MANFNFGPGVVQAGKPVTFVDRSTGNPAPNSWQWEFGDNTSDRTASPTHTYKNAGTYVVTLTVGNGRETARSQPVQIVVAGPDKPPVANFTYEPAHRHRGRSAGAVPRRLGRRSAGHGVELELGRRHPLDRARTSRTPGTSPTATR